MTYPYPVLSALIAGILAADDRTKQELGRRFAFALGFTPGPRGADEGVDGKIIHGDRFIHFQSKLSAKPLDRDEARKYYSDIRYHDASASIMVAGNGYKGTFRERLFQHPDIAKTRIHLLTLEDLIGESEAYQIALQTLPELARLGQAVDWAAFLKQYG